MPFRLHPAATALACLLLVAMLPAPARAQDYFGQNKVRYQSFDFQVLKTEHFDVYYYDETRDMAPEAARMAERWYARLSKALQHDLSRRQPLMLYASHPAFEQTNAIYGDLTEGTGGVTEALKRRIVVPFAGPVAETDHVIGHELVHAFQYDIIGEGRSQTAGLMAASRLPLWFAEGMAEYLTLGADDPHTAMWMRDAAQVNRLPDYGRLEDSRYFPYRYGQSLWAYITGRFGEDAVGRLLKAASRSGDVRPAMQSTLGVPADSVVKGWHQALREWDGALTGRTQAVSRVATPLVMAKRGGGRMNLAPALSPDGSRLLFFSERAQLSIEMYLADAATGKVLRALTRSAVDPEIQNLGFIKSAGEWSPDGTCFVFATASRGRPVLSVMDAGSGRLLHRIRFEQLGEIFHPTWSPDGRRIAFSALAGGVTDLWVLDLDSGRSRRLTDDRWADLQPAWSPDGRDIAFVTDRFGRDGEDPPYGDYGLALVDPESGAIRPIETFPRGKKINPQWSPDGRGLYFIADPEGIPDLYRIELEGGQVEPLTNLRTGVSGITWLSPALTVARRSGDVVFSAYDAGSFELFRFDPARRSSAAAHDSLATAFVAYRDSLARRAAAVRDSVARITAVRDSAARVAADSARVAAAPESAHAVLAAPGGAPPASPAPAAEPPGAPVAVSAPAAPAVAAGEVIPESPAVLPPSPRARPFWADSARSAVAAVDTMRFTSNRYRPRLSLDFVSQPTLGVAAGSSGVAVGGGAGLYWSDMLGDHEMMTLLQMAAIEGSILNNTAAAVVYQNLKSRWNWGVQLSQVPYIIQGWAAGVDSTTTPRTYVEQLTTLWQIERSAMGMVAYPFSRFTRLEFSAGLRNISFAERLKTWTYDETGSVFYGDKTNDHPGGLPSALNLGGGGVALVHDSGIFGGTSPVMGQRFRLETSALGGSIAYHEVLLDYRRYARLSRSLVLAGRAIHYGRYGPGAEDYRLSQMYIGDPSLIRGYDATSLNSDYTNGSDAAALLYERLYGSRLAVANVELRAPLLGALGLFPTPSIPPVEAALFYDAGSAWTRDEKARFLGGTRPTLTSYGVSLRANLLGFAIGELALVHPNNRPGKSWYFVFALQPGF